MKVELKYVNGADNGTVKRTPFCHLYGIVVSMPRYKSMGSSLNSSLRSHHLPPSGSLINGYLGNPGEHIL